MWVHYGVIGKRGHQAAQARIFDWPIYVFNRDNNIITMLRNEVNACGVCLVILLAANSVRKAAALRPNDIQHLIAIGNESAWQNENRMQISLFYLYIDFADVTKTAAAQAITIITFKKVFKFVDMRCHSIFSFCFSRSLALWRSIWLYHSHFKIPF